MAKPPTPLGRLLQERRQQHRYSRTRVGELAGLNPSTIESWEMGKVGKPPIHDVLRLARVLEIPIEELEQAVLPQEPTASAQHQALAPDAPLLDQALVVLGWSESEAADALSTSTARVRALRRGEDQLSVLEVMTLTALIVASRGGATPEQVAQELARLRRSPA